MHGEGNGTTQLLRMFVNKPWHHCGDYYRRIKHTCNRKHFRHFPLRSTSTAAPVPASAPGSASGPAPVPAGATRACTDAADSDDDDEGGEAEDGACAGASTELGQWVLPKTINMKATTLCGVAVEDRLYSPRPGARCISGVPGFGGHVVNHERTGIAFSPVGQGFLCYVGDVNAEAKTLDAIITLLRLPKP